MYVERTTFGKKQDLWGKITWSKRGEGRGGGNKTYKLKRSR